METRLKTAEDFTIPKVYTLQKAEYVKELDSFALVLKHNLSGARILVFSNEDDNKVFSIGFRTPPKDSTGVPHIIEHTGIVRIQAFPGQRPFCRVSKGLAQYVPKCRDLSGQDIISDCKLQRQRFSESDACIYGRRILSKYIRA